MTISSWMMYLAVVMLSTLTPGPAVLLSVTNAIGQGPRASIFSSLGNISGLFVLSAAAMTGIGAVLQTSTTVFTVLKAIGAGYLIYLGIRKWQSVDTGIGIDVEALAKRTPPKLYSQGMLIALTNPKALVFFAALFPQFLDTGNPLVPQFLSLTGTLMVFSFGALIPDGHPKLLHLWPPKLPQAGRLNYQLFGLSVSDFLSWWFLPDFLIFLSKGCLASAARQADGETPGSGGQLSHRCAAPTVHRLALWTGQLSTAGEYFANLPDRGFRDQSEAGTAIRAAACLSR